MIRSTSDDPPAIPLRHVCDDQAGIRRQRSGQGFIYLSPSGNRIDDPDLLERIQKLAIPPAWEDVWICPSPEGHIQATGRDDKGRKQYRYHPLWRKLQSRAKFDLLLDFGRTLPQIRAQTEQDLALSGLPREKVLAVVVRLLENTLIRIGNTQYTRQNKSFGLTTLRDRHVDISTNKVHFEFQGKSGQERAVDIRDRRLARIVKQCRDIPGYQLFQYVDPYGQRHGIESADVNAYLREITGEEFTAKDFRTWAGTIVAAIALEEIGPATTKKQTRSNIVEAVRRVASRLGNRAATARKYYIHPAVTQAYEAGQLLPVLTKAHQTQKPEHTLGSAERAVIRLLENHVAPVLEQSAS